MEPKDPSQQLEVTLRHPSFGEYVFRCEPEQLGNVAEDMLAEAHASSERNAKIKSVDAEQLDLVEQIAHVDARIAAAQLLEDDARVRKEQDARAALEDQVAGLSATREQIVAGPPQTLGRG